MTFPEWANWVGYGLLAFGLIGLVLIVFALRVPRDPFDS